MTGVTNALQEVGDETMVEEGIGTPPTSIEAMKHKTIKMDKLPADQRDWHLMQSLIYQDDAYQWHRTFPPHMLSSQDLAEDKNSEALEDPYNDKLPYTTKQKQKWFKHRMLLCQSSDFLMDPMLRGTIHFKEYTEAEDAAKAFACQTNYLLPHRMNARPNP
ncbi:hypothetical protein ARMSODRAFT_978187 [Armillaria solidipes]|uniref:Uncharacterized protein n=1 Tax=Armillaria solidipes TaxID=1076256 RepID=A0A2H3BA40_9AGAR|nr:hypothetical protein ARMSODRAFT_978187 [Armillaria solidipes]